MKVKRYDFTMSAFRFVFGRGVKTFEVVSNPVPPDAEIFRVHIDPLRNSADVVSLYALSEEFPDLLEGKMPEPIAIGIKQHHHRDDCKCECFKEET